MQHAETSRQILGRICLLDVATSAKAGRWKDSRRAEPVRLARGIGRAKHAMTTGSTRVEGAPCRRVPVLPEHHGSALALSEGMAPPTAFEASPSGSCEDKGLNRP